jgi:hypothetical protein
MSGKSELARGLQAGPHLDSKKSHAEAQRRRAGVAVTASSLKLFSFASLRLCASAPLRETLPLQLRSPGKNPPYRHSRRGATTLESIVVLLVLIVATLAVFQFGLALVVKQAVSHAATVAAREAAKGSDADELVLIVERVLEGHRLQIGEHATLVLEPGQLPAEIRGELPCTPPEQPLLAGDEVRVTVCVSLAAPPFLNILRTYGIDFAGRKFTTSSVAKIE